MYAARSNFAFGLIYWKKIDQQVFGPDNSDDNICDAWKKRPHLLGPEEKEEMEKYVDLKLQEKETRHLFWDLEYMVKMEA